MSFHYTRERGGYRGGRSVESDRVGSSNVGNLIFLVTGHKLERLVKKRRKQILKPKILRYKRTKMTVTRLVDKK